MYIHELTNDECREVLKRTNVGRLACAHENQPYVIPINFAFDGTYFYCFTTLGKKVEWLRSNPLVCFTVDEVVHNHHWTSIIVFGRYEELPDEPKYREARMRAWEFIKQRPQWWEPAYISQEHRDQPHSLTPIFFRIHIDQVTGHCANSDAAETVATGIVAEPDEPREKVSRTRPLSLLYASIIYFALVFGAGFLLGPIRILLVVPHLGERVSELLEVPIMVLVILAASSWIVKKFQLPPAPMYRLVVGFAAFVLGIVFEFSLVLKLRGLSLVDYFATRDPVSGTVYYLTLILFALMPLLVKRNGDRMIAK